MSFFKLVITPVCGVLAFIAFAMATSATSAVLLFVILFFNNVSQMDK